MFRVPNCSSDINISIFLSDFCYYVRMTCSCIPEISCQVILVFNRESMNHSTRVIFELPP